MGWLIGKDETSGPRFDGLRCCSVRAFLTANLEAASRAEVAEWLVMGWALKGGRGIVQEMGSVYRRASIKGEDVCFALADGVPTALADFSKSLVQVAVNAVK